MKEWEEQLLEALWPDPDMVSPIKKPSWVQANGVWYPYNPCLTALDGTCCLRACRATVNHGSRRGWRVGHLPRMYSVLLCLVWDISEFGSHSQPRGHGQPIARGLPRKHPRIRVQGIGRMSCIIHALWMELAGAGCRHKLASTRVGLDRVRQAQNKNADAFEFDFALPRPRLDRRLSALLWGRPLP